MQVLKDVVVVALLVALTVTLAAFGKDQLASTALGGTLGYAVPAGARSARIPPAAAAIGLALLFGAAMGCGGAALPAWVMAIKPATCAGARIYQRLVCDVPETVDVDAGSE